MKRIRAVIDTNVLYAGLYSAKGASYRILISVENGTLIPVLSTTLLFEYEEVLTRNRSELSLRDRDIQDVLDGICACAEQVPVHFLWRPQLPDPKDDHILELAVAADGADIVTFNKKDFRGAERFGVHVMKPVTLLERIL